MKYRQRTDGEGFEVPSGEVYRIACCDCGLVHDFVFVSEDGKPIGVAAKRNARATGQRRRPRSVAQRPEARDGDGSPSSYRARPSEQDLNPVSVKDLSASASPATKEQQ